MMAHHYEDMWASVERMANSKHEPDTYGFKGKSLRQLRDELDKALVDDNEDARLFIRKGRHADGSETPWWHVKSGSDDVGAGNEGYTCPPLPPEECE